MLLTKKVILDPSRTRPIRVAFFSNGPTLPSGYAKVIRELSRRLANDSRFEVIIYNENTNAPQTTWMGIPMFGIPNYGDVRRMVEGFMEVYKKTNPDVIIFLEDSFTLHNFGFEQIIKLPAKRIFYIPLDGDWVPTTGINVLRTMDKIVAMAKFTQKTLGNEGFESDVIWHGVDLFLFEPVSEEKQRTLKKKYGFKEDDFVIYNYGRNSNIRKNNQGMIRILCQYLKDAPENHYAFLHIMDYKIVDIDLEDYLNRHMLLEFGEDVIKKIRFSKSATYAQPASDQEMAEMIQMSDLVISCSSGEGFGLIMAEGMACGKPIIHTDFTTPQELLMDTSSGIGPRGWVVPYAIKHIAGLNTGHVFVKQEEFVEAIKYAVGHPQECKERGLNGRVFAERFLNWDYLIEEWKELILKMV
jgi:glycosyltransferase involved in cell wall biosynthesis